MLVIFLGYAVSWYDLDLTFAAVTLNIKILPKLYSETIRCRKWIFVRDIG